MLAGPLYTERAPMPRPPSLSPQILTVALAGLEEHRRRIEEQIAEVRALMGRRGPGRPPATAQAPTPASVSRTRKRKRKLSAEGRAHYRGHEEALGDVQKSKGLLKLERGDLFFSLFPRRLFRRNLPPLARTLVPVADCLLQRRVDPV